MAAMILALRTLRDVDIEYPLEHLAKAQAHRRRGMGRVSVNRCSVS